MKKSIRFFINRSENNNGPTIFGHRLKQELIKKSHKFDYFFPSVNFIFSSGLFRPFSKNILRLDGLYFDLENTVGNSDNLNKPIFKAYRNADGIIFQSEFSKTLFKKFVGEPKCPYNVIYNGVPSTFCPDGDRIDYKYKKSIICSGNWRIHKRLDCIIEGFLEYDNPEICLVILGWGIKRTVDHPNIKYVGRVLPQDLAKYLRGGDAFISLTWLDNCPNVVIEALACGLPVICSNNGGTKEIVKTNGIVIKCEEDYNFEKIALYGPPKCNSRLIAESIEKILDWPDKVDAEYLRIDHIAEKYLEFAYSILK